MSVFEVIDKHGFDATEAILALARCCAASANWEHTYGRKETDPKAHAKATRTLLKAHTALGVAIWLAFTTQQTKYWDWAAKVERDGKKRRAAAEAKAAPKKAPKKAKRGGSGKAKTRKVH